jgi:hypothetical protein
MLVLQEAGLIGGDLSLSIGINLEPDQPRFLQFGRNVVLIVVAKSKHPISLPTYAMSKVGAQLARLLRRDANLEYLGELAEIFEQQGCAVEAALIENGKPAGRVELLRPKPKEPSP